MSKFIIFSACVTFSVSASASTVLVESLPGSKVTVAQAIKVLAGNKSIYKCEAVMAGPNINPVKVPGSLPSWHDVASIEGAENAFDKLADGKPVYRCSQMKANQATGRINKAK